MHEKSIIRDYQHLKKVVNDEVTSVVDNEQMDVEFSEKIFLHNDEERRVTFEHIRAFYELSKKKKFNTYNFLYYFGHALKGKDQEAYNTPVSRDINDVKKEVFKKIDIKSLGANQGKKIKTLKKIIEEKYY